MTDLIQRIVSAIIRQEGMPADYTNPGNLRDCPWFPMRDIGEGQEARTYADGTIIAYQYSKSGKFWKPDARHEGIAGAAHVVALHIAEGNSLAQLISIWAPAADWNETSEYIKNVAEWAAIPDTSMPLWNYIESAGGAMS